MEEQHDYEGGCTVDSDDYEDLADSIEDEDYLGDEEWAEEIRNKAMSNYKLIVAKNFYN